MVEINLIRKRILRPASERRLVSILVYLVLGMVGLTLLAIFIPYAANLKIIEGYRQKIRVAEAEWETNFRPQPAAGAPERRQLEELKNFKPLFQGRLLMAPKLSALAAQAEPGLVLSGVRFDGTKMALEGEGRRDNQTMVAVVRLVNRLNATPAFREGFQELRIKWIRQDQDRFRFLVEASRQ
ncbi:MAG TPA: hypothetical protein PKN80_02805 [bacterium]|uniref:Fimbrial assembly protein (PilN) n=1 Tax=candidate division TA06 bacterium ADurb.Bin417 TaxID=1852828 RepID=A0A1V5MH95_UNCT6|nr:MAG: hypothetical protein BWY73_00720 [candidate division TA06 bacterium ADurb.Bin417]HNQ34975.1 hypothetical protein [bacterium]HNS48765.1 hypothetical protein [bacterium]